MQASVGADAPVCRAETDGPADMQGRKPADLVGQMVAAFVDTTVLFPAGADELSMDCTCPDWEVPCKHIAAGFYLLAESFDDDPFGILAWRGRDCEALLDGLSALHTGRPAADRAERDDTAVPLASCLDAYFARRPTPPYPGTPHPRPRVMPCSTRSPRSISASAAFPWSTSFAPHTSSSAK